jgi:hypothetical protein
MEEFELLISQLTAVSEEEIKNYALDLNELWLLQFEDRTEGPFEIDDLMSMAEEHSTVLSKCLVCNFQRKDWIPFFNHPKFQRRKDNGPEPKPFRNKEIKSKQYHFLKNGQKRGPHTEKEIFEMVQSGELKMNVLISSDQGRTWRKIYHFDHFDRRKDKVKKTKSNPIKNIERPEDNQFEKSKIYTNHLINKLNESKKEGEEINSALEICQKHLKNNKQKNYFNAINKNFNQIPFLPFGKKHMVRVAILVAVIVAIPLFLADEEHKGKNTKNSDSFFKPIQNLYDSATKRKPAGQKPATRKVKKSNPTVDAYMDNDHLMIDSYDSRDQGNRPVETINNFKQRRDNRRRKPARNRVRPQTRDQDRYGEEQRRKRSRGERKNTVRGLPDDRAILEEDYVEDDYPDGNPDDQEAYIDESDLNEELDPSVEDEFLEEEDDFGDDYYPDSDR